jgi:predicted nucleic acid-binding protein
MMEIGNALAKRRYRKAAVTLLEAIEQDSRIEVVPLSEDLYAQAADLYKRRADKEWGLTDCVSFVLMREKGLQEALTTDDHFRQAGFSCPTEDVNATGASPRRRHPAEDRTLPRAPDGSRQVPP